MLLLQQRPSLLQDMSVSLLLIHRSEQQQCSAEPRELGPFLTKKTFLTGGGMVQGVSGTTPTRPRVLWTYEVSLTLKFT